MSVRSYGAILVTGSLHFDRLCRLPLAKLKTIWRSGGVGVVKALLSVIAVTIVALATLLQTDSPERLRVIRGMRVLLFGKAIRPLKKTAPDLITTAKIMQALFSSY